MSRFDDAVILPDLSPCVGPILRVTGDNSLCGNAHEARRGDPNTHGDGSNDNDFLARRLAPRGQPKQGFYGYEAGARRLLFTLPIPPRRWRGFHLVNNAVVSDRVPVR
jgi:hypothetical protein